MAPEQHLGAVVDARTDQWALGCSLYEALYGARPFDGEDRERLRENVIAGRLRAEPAGSDVPRAVRVAVRRALAPRPADRFADMDAMIAALTVPDRRAWRVAAGALALLALAATVALGLVVRQSRLAATCAGLDAPLAAQWNPSRAQALRARMVEAGRTSEAAAAVLSTLDAYSRRWASMRQQTCIKTRQGVQSAETLDRGMRCLDQRLVEFGGVVDGLLEPGGKSHLAAGDAVDRLRPLSDCDDAREPVPRPPGLEVRREIEGAEANAGARLRVRRAEPVRTRAAVGDRGGGGGQEERLGAARGAGAAARRRVSASAARFHDLAGDARPRRVGGGGGEGRRRRGRGAGAALSRAR